MSARRVVAALQEMGVDPAPLLRRAGLADTDLSDPGRRVSAKDENALIEMAAEAAGEPTFGLRLAEGQVGRETGLIFFVLNASATLAAAIELFGRYIPIANGCRAIETDLAGDGPGTVEFRYVGLPRRLLRHTVEYNVAVFVKCLRDIAGPGVSPVEATFSHYRAGPRDEFERFFGCPVAFGAETDRLTFDRRTLVTATPEGDPALLEILRGCADKAMARLGEREGSFRAAIETELHRRLPQGGGAVDEVARALNIGTRSLVRRLAEEGTSFSEVREALRRSLALQYLSDAQLSLSQVAWLLGYRDIGAFSTAFRRWFDVTPGAARDNPALLGSLDEPADAPDRAG